MLNKNFYKFLFISCLGFANVFAQTSTTSPYSRYGAGDLVFKGLAQNISLGGLGLGLNDPGYINYLNPASYSSLSLTTFEAGANASFVDFTSSASKEKNSGASLSYLALGFPISKKWGTAFGLLPYSSMGYDLSTTETDPNLGQIAYSYTGSGGMNQVFLGNALKINKSLSVGLNISYVFGSLNKTRTIEFPDISYSNSLRVSDHIYVKGFKFNGGLQYTKELKKHTLVIGLSGAMPANLTATNEQLLEHFERSGPFVFPQDTIPNTADNKGKLSLPTEIGVGFILKNSKLQFGLDYTYQDWSTFKLLDQTENLLSTSVISAGIQYTPNSDAVTKYYKLIQYRMGIRFAQTPLELNGVRISEKGINIGAGFPLRKAQSVINLGFEYMQRGATESGLIKEDYMRIHLGLTFSDKWFNKRKYE